MLGVKLFLLWLHYNADLWSDIDEKWRSAGSSFAPTDSNLERYTRGRLLWDSLFICTFFYLLLFNINSLLKTDDI